MSKCYAINTRLLIHNNDPVYDRASTRGLLGWLLWQQQIIYDGDSMGHGRHDIVCNICKWNLHHCHSLSFFLNVTAITALSPALTSCSALHERKSTHLKVGRGFFFLSILWQNDSHGSELPLTATYPIMILENNKPCHNVYCARM